MWVKILLEVASPDNTDANSNSTANNSLERESVDKTKHASGGGGDDKGFRGDDLRSITTLCFCMRQ